VLCELNEHSEQYVKAKGARMGHNLKRSQTFEK
jgi:GTP cyclohydrolase II